MFNHAIHRIAITQLRYPSIPRAHLLRTQAGEGTTREEAIRSLERRLPDVVYRHLVTDQPNRKCPEGHRLPSLRSTDNTSAAHAARLFPSTSG